ncbi:RtcB family protein [Cytobacillus gottheilii]|uniref:RtcB family protein n=1 Tax=Cytobacillus gottheilii TaxID=859144 RepID=UPI0009BB2484|nr:RtcB family protein [Cytobacillus gottheilii]
MLTLKGKYNEAICYTNMIDDATIGQIITLCNQEFAKGSTIRIMPDTHSGKGSVIGTTMTVTDKVVPSLVGVDIGCGLYVVKIKKGRIKMNFEKLDQLIRSRIPSGHQTFEQAEAAFDLSGVYAPIQQGKAQRSLGTLGSGNHFIEVNEGKNAIYLVIHSGSRILGKEIAEYHQEAAYQKLSEDRNSRKHHMKDLQDQGDAEGAEATEELRNEHSVPLELSYVQGEDLQRYLHDMKIAQSYAAANRAQMASTILKGMKWHKDVIETFDCPHNYIDLDEMILRKGAASAKNAQQLIIPLNMRDGSILAVGKGNADWNFSAPHGAGRSLSRSKAKAQISLESYQKAMKKVWTTSVSKKTLDEAPQAYKPAKEIEKSIQDTVDIIEVIKPLYNFKG